MRQSKKIHIRAKHMDCPNGVPRVRVSVKNEVTNTYETIDITHLTNLTMHTLENAVRDHFQDSKTEVTFPQWLKT